MAFPGECALRSSGPTNHLRLGISHVWHRWIRRIAKCDPGSLEGLRRLEYRGYDSAGVAIVRANKLAVYKSKGKVREVAANVPKRVRASVGIGHTRWATHGEPNDQNAHPHVDSGDRIAIVHNGIIENAHQIRRHLEERGVELASNTDSELLAHLIAFERESAATLADAVRQVLKSISGAYGLCVVDRDEPGEIVVARNGSPAVIGIGDGEMFVASDSVALVRHTTNVVYLDDGDVATVRSDGFEITDFDASPVERDESAIETSIGSLEKDGFDHFMLKEIADQPDCIQRTLRGRVDERFNSARLDGLNLSAQDLLNIRRIKILGCGSAYISGLIGGRLIEQLARVPVDAEPAAEFRYRNAIIEPDTLYLAVSQSGKPTTRRSRSKRSNAKAVPSEASSMRSAVRSHARAMAGCICMRGRKSPSSRRRRSSAR